MKRRHFVAAGAASVAMPLPVRAAADFRGELKITGLKTILLRFPPGKPYWDAIHQFGLERGGLVVQLETNAGLTGWAYSSFGMVAGGPHVVQTIVEEELKPVLIGQDPAFAKRLRESMWQATEYHGVQGVAQFGIAAVDIAIWDLIGKAAGQPVWRVLGAARDRMPVYNMCGWYYDEDADLSHFKKSLSAAVEEGFRAVKIKVGRNGLDDDTRRIEAAKQLVGSGVRIMVDANQALVRNEALRRGRVYQQLGCFWYEEPLPPHEKEGYAELAAQLDIRIATGENEYTKYAFLDLLKRSAVDVVQPDNRRAGGPTEWMEIAALAGAFGVEIASHGGGPTNLHMLLAMPNAIYMETGSIKGDTANREALKMVNGEVLAPQSAGMGSELRQDYLDKYKV
jgi:L-alanine-DL-glutamate epimerase-like enolase superfamily enzyme